MEKAASVNIFHHDAVTPRRPNKLRRFFQRDTPPRALANIGAAKCRFI
jgi:hypothetical protein